VTFKSFLPAGALAAVALLSAACSATNAATTTPKGGGGTSASAAGPKVSITPSDGTSGVKPDSRISITTDSGGLTQISVRSKGKDVPGTLSPDKKSWQAKWTLTPGRSYTVSATATGTTGRTTTSSSSFTTKSLHSGLEVTGITPARGQKVGVGMPITITFNRTVTDKAAVERALEITTEKSVTGAWNWQSGSTVMFRTKNGQYWPANQTVTVTAHLAGVKSGSSYGLEDASHTFKIGDSHILRVSNKTKHAVAYENGKRVNSWAVSMGQSSPRTWTTTSGVHLTMDHENPAHMDSRWMGVDPSDKAHGGYSEDVPWATRITNSGEFVHETMGDEGCLGRVNCSHGCVRSTLAGAKWFYNWSYIGDPVIISGTGRTLDAGDGWNASYMVFWSDWVKGSALDEPVTTGSGA